MIVAARMAMPSTGGVNVRMVLLAAGSNGLQGSHVDAIAVFNQHTLHSHFVSSSTARIKGPGAQQREITGAERQRPGVLQFGR